MSSRSYFRWKPEQKRTESAPLLRRFTHGIFFEEATEESLDQILRVMMRLPALAEEKVERLPVSAQEGFERGVGGWSVEATGGQHHAPMRRGEDREHSARIHLEDCIESGRQFKSVA